MVEKCVFLTDSMEQTSMIMEIMTQCPFKLDSCYWQIWIIKIAKGEENKQEHRIYSTTHVMQGRKLRWEGSGEI